MDGRLSLRVGGELHEGTACPREEAVQGEGLKGARGQGDRELWVAPQDQTHAVRASRAFRQLDNQTEPGQTVRELDRLWSSQPGIHSLGQSESRTLFRQPIRVCHTL
jgi:hypothetical protein